MRGETTRQCPAASRLAHATTGLAIILLVGAVFAQPPIPRARPAARPAPDPEFEDEDLVIAPGLKFENAPLDMVLQQYAELTQRTLLMAPGVKAPNITLRNETDLTPGESLQAIETVLSMHGVGLVKAGDKFVKVVPIAAIQEAAMEINETVPDGFAEETGEVISQMIQLKHIDIPEATKAIAPLTHKAYGKITSFERVNSILLTDTIENINRIRQIIMYIDQPAEVREEPNIVQIRHAKAADIKRKLEEIIAEAKKEEQKSTVPRPSDRGRPGVVAPRVSSIPGVIRARAAAARTQAAATVEELIEMAERGIIRGEIRMVADERTNILIIITRPENMAFFEKIIDVLDVETDPDVMVKVIRLEFAEAKTVATMLNELIGAASKDEGNLAAGASTGAQEGERSAALREYVEQRTTAAATAERKSKVGQLSQENIKILSDERTNSLIIMASRGDLKTLEEIIQDMDMRLAQVLIESVIIEVDLDETVTTGVDWLQRAMVAYEKKGDGSRRARTAYAGRGGGGKLTPVNALTASSFPAGAGLSYYLTLFDLNVDAVISMAATDNRSKVISTPAILTTDNTEATIASTEKIYVNAGTRYDEAGNAYEDFDTEAVGLTLKVKPQINKNNVVMMTISQKMSEPGDTGAAVSGRTISSERSIEASIAVPDRQTIVLGGQVRESHNVDRAKIPVLGDIPILGRLFGWRESVRGTTETVVFITPYVITTPEEVESETARRKEALNIGGVWKRGWSDSTMAEPSKKELEELKRTREEEQRELIEEEKARKRKLAQAEKQRKQREKEERRRKKEEAALADTVEEAESGAAEEEGDEQEPDEDVPASVPEAGVRAPEAPVEAGTRTALASSLGEGRVKLPDAESLVPPEVLVPALRKRMETIDVAIDPPRELSLELDLIPAADLGKIMERDGVDALPDVAVVVKGAGGVPAALDRQVGALEVEVGSAVAASAKPLPKTGEDFGVAGRAPSAGRGKAARVLPIVQDKDMVMEQQMEDMEAEVEAALSVWREEEGARIRNGAAPAISEAARPSEPAREKTRKRAAPSSLERDFIEMEEEVIEPVAVVAVSDGEALEAVIPDRAVADSPDVEPETAGAVKQPAFNIDPDLAVVMSEDERLALPARAPEPRPTRLPAKRRREDEALHKADRTAPGLRRFIRQQEEKWRLRMDRAGE